jgi:tetratricopeptide (TPR) repeat protein
MGLVLAAHEVDLDRKVAIKLLLPGTSSAVARARFVTEARLTARLPHPAIPPIHELGTCADGSPFLVMKLIRGRTLADELKARAGTATDLVKYIIVFEQVAQALGFAHSQGVIHRDLKPTNIMVGEFGEVQVMDWGIAKELGARASGAAEPAPPGPAPEGSTQTHAQRTDLTVAGSVLGTPAYMAPEQARGELDRLGPRTDVFALGCILCDVLTGAPPFAGTSPAAVLKQAASGDVGAALDRLDRSGAEPELVALARSCLSPDPAGRPADGGAVAAAVATARASVRERLKRAEAARAEAEIKAAEQRKRRRWQALAAATAVALLLGGVAFAWWDDKQAADRDAEAFRDQVNDEKRARTRNEFLARNGKDIDTALTLCEEALRADDSDRAATALDRAEKRLVEGGGEPYEARFARCRTDVPLLRELDTGDDLQWAVRDGTCQGPRVDIGHWAAAFRQLGAEPGAVAPAEIARRVGASLVREQLIASLDRWFVFARTSAACEALRACDPDPYRNAVRAALLGGDDRALGELAGRADALDQPPRFAVVLGALAGVPGGRREQILRAAYRLRPDDFTILMTLGGLSVDEGSVGHGESWRGPGYGTGVERPQVKERAAESAGWYRAAIVARPKSVAAWNNLGVALKAKGDLDGAIASGNVALHIDKKCGPVYNNLGNSLLAKGDAAGAIAAYSQSIALEPSCPLAHCNLGAVYWRRGEWDKAAKEFEDAVRLWPRDRTAQDHLEKVRKRVPPPKPPPAPDGGTRPGDKR